MLNWLPDKVFLEAAFRARFGRKLNLNNPETFNEKLQWLKLYNRKPEYTKMVDKYLVRDYVKEKIGEEYLIPLLGVWDDPEKIDFDELPMQFVLKCNHNSGLGMCICKDKNSLDINKVKEELKKGINQNYYLTSREWPYKDVPRRIIAEKYMVDESGYELKDYKFYCFDGKVKLVMINSDRMSSEKTKANYFDENYQPLDFVWGYENAEIPPQKPEKFEEMKYLAEKLSEGITHVRIDFYQTPSGIYFGEITFFDGSGFDAIEPIEWDYKIGSWLKLPMEKVK
ncbi:MAG: ATP-grasp fold amidoligase family protein [Clostridium sp.]